MTAALSLSSPEQLRFNSEVLPEAERFERYRDLYAPGADAVQYGPDFAAHVRGWRLDRAVLYDRRLHAVGHERSAHQVTRDGFDHFTLTLLVSGTLEVDTGWGFVRLLPGQMILQDTTRPGRNRMTDAHIITTSVARERVQVVVRDLEPLNGLVLPGAQAGLLGDYLQALAHRLPGVPAACIPAVTQPIATLLAVALASGGEALPMPGHADRVRQLIEAQLSDPAFGTAQAVALSGLSRATLYRLFQGQGGLALYIQRRRLNRVRMALADPNEARSFAELAHGAGFASESHCSRLFHETFGSRPGEFRAAALGSEQAAVHPVGGGVVGRMEYLQDEVR